MLSDNGALSVIDDREPSSEGAAFHRHFGLHCEPFGLTADPDFLFLSPSHAEAVAALELAIRQARGLAVLTGEVGTGKSTLVACLSENWQQDGRADVAIVSAGLLDFDDVLALTLQEFGLPNGGASRADRLQHLRSHLQEVGKDGRLAVLIIDEAQNLSDDAFEQLRLLLNIETSKAKLLQLVLVGQPELSRRLTQKPLRHVADRVAIRAHIEPLEIADVGDYVRHRLEVAGARRPLFSNTGLTLIARHSRGVPRQLNVLCHNALLFAYGDGVDSVLTEHARRAIKNALPRGPVARRQQALETMGSAGARIALMTVATLAIAFLTWIAWPSASPLDTAPTPSLKPDVPSTPTANLNVEEGNEVVEEPSNGEITVSLGDSLYSIVSERYGRYDQEVMSHVLRANPDLDDPNRLSIGTVIQLPPLTRADPSTRSSHDDDSDEERADSSTVTDAPTESTTQPAVTSNSPPAQTLDIDTESGTSSNQRDESYDAVEANKQEDGSTVVRLPEGRSLSGMIQDHYRRYTPALLERVLDANPSIQNVRTLMPGTPIRLPVLDESLVSRMTARTSRTVEPDLRSPSEP